MVFLICSLIITDLSVSRICINHTFENGRSVFILFGFEFGLLVINIFNISFRYIIQWIDANMANGLNCKGISLMLCDLLSDALKFITYSFFFCLVFVYYGLPIHIIREVWVSFLAFQSRLVSFLKYIQLNSNLDQRFDDATIEEMESAGACLICREVMTSAKKLPCNHVFHLHCLRDMLQHQHSCPLCRSDIPLNSTRSRAAVAAEVRAEHANDLNEPMPNADMDLQQAAGGDASHAVPGDVTRSASDSGLPASTTKPKKASTIQPEFPCFFKIKSKQACPVYSSPILSSFSPRNLNLGVVIFALERLVTEDGTTWLHMPDGWILERRGEGLTFDAEVFVESFQHIKSSMPLHRGSSTSSKLCAAHRRLLPGSARQSVQGDELHRGKRHLKTRQGSTGDPLLFSSTMYTSSANASSSDSLLRKLAVLEDELSAMNFQLQLFLRQMASTQELVGELRQGNDLKPRQGIEWI